MARRDITDRIPEGDGEGLCYEVERARKEGLWEEAEIFYYNPTDMDRELIPAGMPDPAKFEFAHQLDSSVNIPPDDQVEFMVMVRYKYGYGEA